MKRLSVKKIIYLSSGGAVYGNVDQSPINEDSPIKPISSYGIVKSTIEHYILLYNRLYNIDYLIIRPSNPYGPRQGHFIAQGVISTFLRKSANLESFSVYGDGSATKDYIYISDFVSLLWQLTEKDAQGIFNIGSGTGIDLNQIISCINSVTGIKNEVNYSIQKSYDVNNFILDISRLKKVIGEINFTSLEEGIKNTWNWVKEIR
jgi:UDP-glucose 4-epimerase